jgi:hypothetical protein
MMDVHTVRAALMWHQCMPDDRQSKVVPAPFSGAWASTVKPVYGRRKVLLALLASLGGYALSPQECDFSQFRPALLAHEQCLQRCIHTLPVLGTDELMDSHVSSGLEPLCTSKDSLLPMEAHTSGSMATLSEQGKGPVKLLNALRKLITALLPLCRPRMSRSACAYDRVVDDDLGHNETLCTSKLKTRVVEVTGPQGSGKSAIVRVAALACCAAEALFSPFATVTLRSNLSWIAVFYVDLSLCFTMDAAIVRLSQAFGLVPHEMDSRLPMAWLTFQYKKRQAPLGVILDNVDSMCHEHLKLMVDQLVSSHPELQVLVTSRRAILSKEKMAIPVLIPPLPQVGSTIPTLVLNFIACWCAPDSCLHTLRVCPKKGINDFFLLCQLLA